MVEGIFLITVLFLVFGFFCHSNDNHFLIFTFLSMKEINFVLCKPFFWLVISAKGSLGGEPLR